MKIIKYNDKNFRKFLDDLNKRPPYPPEIEFSVKNILQDIRENGNSAVKKYAKVYDGANLNVSQFKVSEQEINVATRKVDSECKNAIRTALENIMNFARERIPKPWSYSPRKGVILGERYEPLSRVGVYIPGGTAPLVSTVIHTAGIAKAAGVEQIVAVTPPNKNGDVHPAILYALRKAGVDEIYRLGGVYGIGAMAYGTKTIKKVDKIVGPGNAYVTAAKKLVYGEVAIDMVAGPSEIMVIADETGDPDLIAADMLSQAEHGSGYEQAVVVSNSPIILKAASKSMKYQATQLSRRATVKKVMENGFFFVLVKDMKQAAEVASAYAPEHLEIMCKHAGQIAKQIKAAGAIFLGKWTPESVGDFVAGPSHVLPTSGSARYFSGLTVEQFFRRMSILNYQKSALIEEEPVIAKFAEMEGLDAHGRCASIRVKK